MPIITRKPAVEASVAQPYVGPRPYERTEGDKERFFARDREAEELAALITAHGAVLLYASSGAGKTSLINTKLDSLLRAIPAEVVPAVRVRSETDSPASAQRPAAGNVFVGNVLHNWGASGLSSTGTLAGFLEQRKSDSRLWLRVGLAGGHLRPVRGDLHELFRALAAPPGVFRASA